MDGFKCIVTSLVLGWVNSFQSSSLPWTPSNQPAKIRSANSVGTFQWKKQVFVYSWLILTAVNRNVQYGEFEGLQMLHLLLSQKFFIKKMFLSCLYWLDTERRIGAFYQWVVKDNNNKTEGKEESTNELYKNKCKHDFWQKRVMMNFPRKVKLGPSF